MFNSIILINNVYVDILMQHLVPWDVGMEAMCLLPQLGWSLFHLCGDYELFISKSKN
jgi:hypothetical protein